MLSLVLALLTGGGLDFRVVSYPTPREVRQALADLEATKAEVAALKTRIEQLEAPSRSAVAKAADCKCSDACGEQCVCTAAGKCNGADCPVSAPGELQVTVTPATPDVTGWKAVNGQWLPMAPDEIAAQQAAPQVSPVVQQPAFMECSSGACRPARKRGLFGRRK